MTDDAALLRRYAEDRDEAAFAELVRRNVDAVYSVALRRAGHDAHLAQDIAQRVFVALARDARRLEKHPVLTGWLYTTTRYAAANAVRGERRRKQREQEAHAMEDALSKGPTETDWRQVTAVLDDALDTLAEPDRLAVLLRFMDRRSFADVGTALGVAEDTARKRVDRALDKLRTALGRRGVVSTASALAGALAQGAVTAAPAGLAATATTAALAGGGALAGTLAFLSMTKLQAGLVAAVIVSGTAGLVWQHQRIAQLDGNRAALQSELASLRGDNTRLSEGRTDDAKQIVALRDEVAALKAARVTAASPPARNAKDAVTASYATTPDTSNVVLPANVQGRVSRLDTLVHLTPEQKAKIAAVFAKEAAALDGFAAGEERALKGGEARQASRAEVRALLTDDQRSKYDVSPQQLGGGLPANPDNLTLFMDQAIPLTAEQKKQVSAILWDEITDQIAAMPPDKALPGFRWSDKVRDRLRAVLTPEQQAKFDVTPPYARRVAPSVR